MGLALGFLGTALLAGITPARAATADLRGPIALTLASASWALGTRLLEAPSVPTTFPYAAAAVQMLAGAIAAVSWDWLLGRGGRLAARPPTGLWAMVYLIVIGSIVGFTAYRLRAADTRRRRWSGTYAYVNPVVAVMLGWLVLHEEITGRKLARWR